MWPYFRGRYPIGKELVADSLGSELPLIQIYRVWRHYRGRLNGVGGWGAGELPWAALGSLGRESGGPCITIFSGNTIRGMWYVRQSSPMSLINKLFEGVLQWQLQRIQAHAGVEVGEVWLQPLSLMLETEGG